MHDLPYSITAPIASMHDHVNACSWHQSKKRKEKPNRMLKRTSIQIGGQRLRNHEKGTKH